jgi:hypothetical protein
MKVPCELHSALTLFGSGIAGGNLVLVMVLLNVD